MFSFKLYFSTTLLTFSDINFSSHLLEIRTTEDIHQGWDAYPLFSLLLTFLKSHGSPIVLPVSISAFQISLFLCPLNRWNAVTAIILLNVLISLFSSAYSEVGFCIRLFAYGCWLL